MKDSYRHKGLRKKLVDGLQNKGIREEAILQAMINIPRHFFLEKAFEEWAYEDKAFPIGYQQTISQPYTVAYQTTLLQIQKRDKVLEIGTGSGYQACVLAEMGARVFTIERQEGLYLRTKEFLPKIGYAHIRLFFKDGYKGLPEFAPFEKILVTAGAERIPQALKSQLAIGGILVIPVGSRKSQLMWRLTRLSETEYREEAFDRFKFVPFVEGTDRLEK